METRFLKNEEAKGVKCRFQSWNKPDIHQPLFTKYPVSYLSVNQTIF